MKTVNSVQNPWAEKQVKVEFTKEINGASEIPWMFNIIVSEYVSFPRDI